MSRPRHPKKEIEDALQFVENNGWKVFPNNGGSSHGWGKMHCPYFRGNKHCIDTKDRCIQSIWSSPHTGNHHKNIRRIVKNCIAYQDGGEND